MDFLDVVKSELKFQKSILKQFNMLRRIRDDGQLFCERKRSGYISFYIKGEFDSRRRYVRKLSDRDMHRVYRLQAKGFGTFAAERAENNIRLITELLGGYKSCDAESLLADLPDPFRADVIGGGARAYIEKIHIFHQSEKPDRRDELKHSTSFGLWTRSKNEALIAERLHAAGLEFYYEKKLVLIDENGKRHVVYPDFTIITADGMVIYWEHKGMLNDDAYMEYDCSRMKLYYINGIYQPHNLIVTSDGPRGEHCGAEIGMIIDNFLVPMASGRF